ncbi:MAG: lytic transglycosylase domain-containing protein [Alphaproteobacteria bacterium]|nr:lytic transglycosylase domain-containing protein [Rickettsiales bacterium]
MFAATLEEQRGFGESAICAAKKSKCADYKFLLSKINSPAIRDAVLLNIGVAGGSCVSLGEIISLIDYRSEGGLKSGVVARDAVIAIQRKANNLIDSEKERVFLFVEDILEDFEGLDTQTVIRIIDIMKKTTVDKVVLKKHINKVWHSYKFNLKQWEKFFYNNKNYINEASHLRNVQIMILSGNKNAVFDTINYFEDDCVRKMLRDGIAIANGISKNEAIEMVKEYDNSYFMTILTLINCSDLSLEDRYNLVNNLRKEIIILPQLLCKHIGYVVRSCIGSVEPSKLYALLKKVTMLQGVDFIDHAIFTGWFVLEICNDPQEALRLFKKIKLSTALPSTRAKLHYWTGRAFVKNGEIEKGRKCYVLGSQYPFSFYGKISIEELEEDVISVVHNKLISLDKLSKLCSSLSTDFLLELGYFANKHVNKWHAISYMKDGMLMLAESGNVDVCYVRNIVLSLDRQSNYYFGIKSADFNMPISEVSFPITKHSKIPLIQAIIRQEGAFNGVFRSNKGAVGLMQIMEPTGKMIVKSLYGKFDRSMLLDDGYNVAIGQLFLKDLSDKFKSLPVFIAAYNAGPTRVSSWLDRIGNPYHDRYKIINWVESIPYKETREYVIEVLSAKVVYDGLMLKKYA